MSRVESASGGIAARWRWNRLVKLALTGGAFVALAIAAWRFREAITNVISSTNPWLLGLSTVIALLANYLTGFPFHRFLSQAGIESSPARACYLQLVAQVAKYIPGNIWSAVLQAQLIGSGRIGALFLAGIDVSIFFMMTVTSTGLGLLIYCQSPALGWAVALCGWLLSASIASSAWLIRLIDRLACLLGKQLHAPAISSSTREIARLFAWASIHSVTMLLSIFCMLIATTPYRHADLIISVASICLAWVAGTIAIFVPSGLGVREVAFVYLASKFGVSADIKLLGAISIVARVTQTLPDILAAGVVGVVELSSSLRRRRPE
ncbi:flippase-like domain-containing protein [Dyella halodurans]|uniref:Lysylphosphatidylglycerol synthase domain-containing protein n=1 Tax=Dyella halodurans TaxID=1920171 RepID=A0ABV9C697_9GAMM|nr:lysylphosphatidylglycerol synthase domain-containing protein [Dyella halodurans]